MTTSKRSGSRDISDLKARLGLKKKASTGGRRPTVIPPPAGVKRPPTGGSIPVPPGAVPPPSQTFVVPNASEDPFGAMNAMAANQAAVATATAAATPALPAGEEKAVARVQRPKAHYALLAVVIAVPLLIGAVMGQIGNSAKTYNRTIQDASKIRADVEAAGKQLINLQQVLQVAQERGPRKNDKPWYKTNDEKLTKELAELPALTFKPEVVYKSFVYDLPPEISGQIFMFYTELGQLKKMLKEHIKRSPENATAIAEAMKRYQTFNPRGFAALVTAPKAEQAREGAPMQVRIVELGLPICKAGGRPTPKGCPGLPAASQYRLSAGGNWGTKKVQGPNEPVLDGSLVLINPGTPFFDGLLKGGAGSVAEVSYNKRIAEIHQQVEDLIQVRKFILDVLNNKANESERFTFFM